MVVIKLLSVSFSLQEYGTYSQALLITSTAASASILGLTNAVNYFYNRTSDCEEKRRYISTIFSLQYVSGALCLIAVYFFRGSIASYFSNDSLESVLLIIAATPLLTNLIAMYQNLFVSIGRAKVIAVRNFAVSVLRLCAVAAACFVTEDIATVLLVTLFMDAVQVGCFAIGFAKVEFWISPKDMDHTLVREILVFSIPMAVYVLTNTLMCDIDKYVISRFSGAEVLAVYANAAKPLPFDMLTTSLITVLVPIITRLIHQKNFREAQCIFKLYLRIGCILTGILTGGAIAVANHLIVFLYDEKYAFGLPVFIVYLFVDMIRFANVTTLLSGAGKTRILMITSVASLLANAVFNVISYQLVGALGPALTTLGLTIFMTVVLLHYGAKEIQTSTTYLFDFKEMVVVGCEMAGLGGIAHFLSNFLRYQLNAPLLVVLAVSYGLYLTVLFGLNYRRVLEAFRELDQYRS